MGYNGGLASVRNMSIEDGQDVGKQFAECVALLQLWRMTVAVAQQVQRKDFVLPTGKEVHNLFPTLGRLSSSMNKVE